jgi:mono/diheme cytochrome c family protein/uncharacterized membrane protein
MQIPKREDRTMQGGNQTIGQKLSTSDGSDRRGMLLCLVLAASAALPPGFAWTQQPTLPVRDIGGEVRRVFASKCANCHGLDLAKPKGRFGYVLDLQRVAGNPELVIPQRPTESELWILIERNEMPPANSPRGALRPEQKEIVRTWILAGAPDASPDSVASSPSVQSELDVLEPVEIGRVDRIIRWLGKFHLVLLHFPIALILAAGLGETWSWWQRNPVPSGSVRFCLWLGALAAIPTAGLGWLFAMAGNGVDSPLLLTAHRWLGTTAAVWLLITLFVAERDARRGRRSRSGVFLLAFGVLLIALAAHLGGLLGRGEDFFAY